jgi:hypothetical protein
VQAPGARPARVLYEQGRYEEAVYRGELERAESWAGEAVRLAEQTACILFHMDALLDLAEVLRLAGRPDDARVACREGILLYDARATSQREKPAPGSPTFKLFLALRTRFRKNPTATV